MSESRPGSSARGVAGSPADRLGSRLLAPPRPPDRKRARSWGHLALALLLSSAYHALALAIVVMLLTAPVADDVFPIFLDAPPAPSPGGALALPPRSDAPARPTALANRSWPGPPPLAMGRPPVPSLAPPAPPPASPARPDRGAAPAARRQEIQVASSRPSVPAPAPAPPVPIPAPAAEPGPPATPPVPPEFAAQEHAVASAPPPEPEPKPADAPLPVAPRPAEPPPAPTVTAGRADAEAPAPELSSLGSTLSLEPERTAGLLPSEPVSPPDLAPIQGLPEPGWTMDPPPTSMSEARRSEVRFGRSAPAPEGSTVARGPRGDLDATEPTPDIPPDADVPAVAEPVLPLDPQGSEPIVKPGVSMSVARRSEIEFGRSTPARRAAPSQTARPATKPAVSAPEPPRPVRPVEEVKTLPPVAPLAPAVPAPSVAAVAPPAQSESPRPSTDAAAQAAAQSEALPAPGAPAAPRAVDGALEWQAPLPVEPAPAPPRAVAGAPDFNEALAWRAPDSAPAAPAAPPTAARPTGPAGPEADEARAWSQPSRPVAVLPGAPISPALPSSPGAPTLPDSPGAPALPPLALIPVPAFTGTPDVPPGLSPEPSIASRAGTPRAGAGPTPPSPPTSGIGLARLQVQLDGPRTRVTQQAQETITGAVVSGNATRAVLSVGGLEREVPLIGNRFRVQVPLEEGVNQVRIVATDAAGQSSEDSVIVQYRPPGGHAIAILSPADGHTLTAADPPAILVQGKVDDPRLGAVWIAVNGWRLVVPVVNGRFSAAVPVVEPFVRIWAQVASGEDAEKSQVVTVKAEAATPTAVVLLESLPGASSPGVEASPPVAVSWRGRVDRLDGPTAPVPLHTFAPPDSATRVLFLRNPRPGAYTFRRVTPGRDAPATIFAGPGQGARPRELPAARATPGAVVRLLLPYGVFWDQNEWFTGQSQGSDTITKFRIPEGVTWIERKGSPR